MGEKNVYNYTKGTNEEQPVNGLPSRFERPRSVWSYKRLWAVIILFLFIGGVGGLIPAAKIPLFSALVQAMGFSKEDAGEMSLLQALLKWHQKLQAQQADKSAPLSADEIEANARASAERSLALSAYESEQNKNNLTSSLINMRKLNSDQRRKGEPVDAIRGAVKQIAGDEKEDNAVKVKNIDVPVVKTESNTDTKSEVFFGQDAGVTPRDIRDGFNSTKILTKIENPHIAGSTSATWLTDMIDKAMIRDVNLGQLPKELNTKGHGVNFDDIKNVGKDRPHRDLNYAWLTGKATYRTPNRLLKKTLAAAGFNGEDMPRRVFDASLLGVGLGIDPTEVNQDAQSIRDRMAKDEKCQSKLSSQSPKKNSYENIKKSIGQIAKSFPRTCADVLKSGSSDNLNAHLSSISKECKAINSYYSELQTDCNVAFKKGDCPVLRYEGSFNAFVAACEDVYKKCMAETTTDEAGNEVAANDAKTCAARRDGTEGKTLQCGNDACTGDPIERNVSFVVTGYTDTNSQEFTDSFDVKTGDGGNNISGEYHSNGIDVAQGGYMPSKCE